MNLDFSGLQEVIEWNIYKRKNTNFGEFGARTLVEKEIQEVSYKKIIFFFCRLHRGKLQQEKGKCLLLLGIGIMASGLP